MGDVPEKQALTEAELIINSADADGSGEIEFAEFAQIWQRKILSTNEQYVKDIFTVFDENGDGQIDAEELAKVIEGDEDEIKELIREIDTDGDGVISFEEFKAA